MIITKTKFAVHKNGKGGKWRKGYMALTADECDMLHWQPKDVVLVIAEPDEDLSVEKIKESLDRYKKTIEMEKEIDKMRKEMQ